MTSVEGKNGDVAGENGKPEGGKPEGEKTEGGDGFQAYNYDARGRRTSINPDGEETDYLRRIAAKSERRSSTTPSMHSDSGSINKYKPRKRLSKQFESHDYNTVENSLFLRDQEHLRPRKVAQTNKARWFVNFLIGVYVALIAVLVALAITYICKGKFMALYILLENCDSVACLVGPTFAWIGINVALVTIGSYIVTYHAPTAAGSGIPQIKCYLNGIKIPGLLSLKTLVAKAGGVCLSVGGGLACGKEGPMIHSGAICASGMGRGEFYCCGKGCSPKCSEPLRVDEERRDFVAAGAASGVSAAFASPVGGVLFSLEEGASFLNQMLTWRMLFSSMTASLTLNIIMSAIKGHPGDMSHPGLISFGYVGDVTFKTWELPFFMVMAVVGGLSGALFIQLNYYITLWRRRVVTRNWMKVFEAAFVAAASALILMLLIYGVPDCQPIRGYTPAPPAGNDSTGLINDTSVHHDVHRRSAGDEAGDHDSADHHHGDGNGTGDHPLYGYDDHHHGYMFQGFCPYGEHNRMADILFKTPEGGLHAMLHAPKDEWNYLPLVVLLVVYHLLATWTYGLMVSSGVFIPSLLVGAIWGRLIGMVVLTYIPSFGTNIAKYVLIGAACQLGGTVRMTISLTVIVIECTGDITFGIPIMLSLIIAKWIGDYFNPGIYDLHIEIMGIPLLPWEPPHMCAHVTAKEVMSTPAIVMRSVENIGRIVGIMNDEEDGHNGFPVVEDYDPDNMESMRSGTFGRLKGFILRSTLQHILEENGEVSEEEYGGTIDLRMHMDRAPYSINEDVSLPKIFKLFRGLGLRHLVVTNDRNRVVGIVTRINLARYRGETHKGKPIIEELHIMEA